MLDHQCLISICRKLSCLLHVENHLPHSHLSYDIATNSKLVFLGDSGMPGYVHPKLYNHLVENFLCLSAGKKSTSPSYFSGEM